MEQRTGVGNQVPTIGSMIRFSWNKSKEILFPFRFKRWFKILIIVWLASAGIQGMNFNWNSPKKSETPPVQPTTPKTNQEAAKTESSFVSSQASSSAVSSEIKIVPGQVPAATASQTARPTTLSFPKPKINSGLKVLAIAGAVVAGLGFLLFFAWLSARFHFILLDVLVKRSPAIRGPFKEHKEIGNSLFWWSLGFFGISLGVIIFILLIAWLLIGIVKGNIGISIFVGVIAVLLFLGSIFLMVTTGMMASDFVAPIMYRQKIPTTIAFNRLLESDVFGFWAVLQYLIVVFGLWILAAVAQTIIGMIVLLCGLIVGAIGIIPGFLVGVILPFLKIPLIFLGSFFLLALIFAVVVSIGMVMLPVALFFRIFSLAYLTRLYPDCDLLGITS